MGRDAREITELPQGTPTAATPPKPPQPVPTARASEYARPAKATLTDAIKSITLEDFKSVHKQPCVRNSLLYGIGTGFAFGGLKLILKAPIPRAANWAAGTFGGASLVMYEFCQYRRYREKAGMQRAIEVMGRRKAEREKQIAEEKERLKREAEERNALEATKPWYKFW